MQRFNFLAAAASVALIGGLAASADADVLLTVDLSTPNQVTINATTGLSAATVSGSDTTGALMAGFYGSPAPAGLIYSNGAGNLTNFLNPPDNSPGLFSSTGETGLNIWTWSSDATVNFTAGVQAFSGSATWTVTAAEYAALLGGPAGGDLYFPADDDGDIGNATLLGQWSLANVPEPASASVMGLAGLVLLRRRRA